MATRRRGRALIFVAVILILILVLAFAAWRMLGTVIVPQTTAETPLPAEPTVEPTPELVYIVMTSQNVPRGGNLNRENLTLFAIPQSEYADSDFFGEIDDDDPETLTIIEVLEEEGARAFIDLPAHTPLSKKMVVNSEDILNRKASASSFMIQKGMVAISIPVGKLSSVSYGLRPGDHVNVIASLLMIDIDPSFQSRLPNTTANVTLPGRLADQFTGVAQIDAGVAGRGEYDPTLGTPIYVIPSESQRPRLVSQTLIQDAIILQVGIFSQEDPNAREDGAVVPTPDPAAAPAAPAEPQPTAVPPAVSVPDVVTLIVSPQDAVTINYLLLAGARLNLVMRSAGDDQITQTEPVTLQFVMDQYVIPNPAKLPYGVEPRTDVGVTQNSNVYFVQPFPDIGVIPTALPIETPTP